MLNFFANNPIVNIRYISIFIQFESLKWYVELAWVYMTLYGRLVEPLEVGKISTVGILV